MTVLGDLSNAKFFVGELYDMLYEFSTPYLKEQPAGYISSATWSPDFDTNVAIGMLEQACWQPGLRLVAKTPAGERAALVKENFWI